MSGSITESGLGLGPSRASNSKNPSTPPPSSSSPANRRRRSRQCRTGRVLWSSRTATLGIPTPTARRTKPYRTSPSPTLPSLVMFNNTHHQCCLSTSWRNPAAGFAPSWRSPVSALVAKARLIGNAGSSLSVFFFFLMISRALLLVLLIAKNGVFFVVSICRYGKYQPLTEPAKW